MNFKHYGYTSVLLWLFIDLNHFEPSILSGIGNIPFPILKTGKYFRHCKKKGDFELIYKGQGPKYHTGPDTIHFP